MESSSPRLIDTNDAILSVIDVLDSYEKDIRFKGESLGNIYSVFFHDLVIHFSGILIQRETAGSVRDIVRFPFVGREYALSPGLIDLNLVRETSARESINTKLRQIRLLSLAIGNSIPLGYKQDYWLSKFLNLFGEFQKPAKVFIDDLGFQLDNLCECIYDICSQHSILNPDSIRRNWIEYVSHHSIKDLIPVESKILLVGNRQDLQNRKLAHNYLEQGKEVIAFTHGEIASTIFDEPMYRYAERGLCSTLVEYGEPPSLEQREEIMIEPKRTLYRNSLVARSIYRPSSNITSKKLDCVKLLYIPTMYVGNHIYGPFHAYPDPVYWEWHSAIFRLLPSVVFKAHPKSRGSLNLPGREENRWLDDCINDYDVLMLDYVATSTALAMLTDKPVIFFDIGLRRAKDDFMRVIKERCHYVTIDINGNLDLQLQGGIASFSSCDCCWSNLNVGKYCLLEKELFRWKDIFFDSMKKIIF